MLLARGVLPAAWRQPATLRGDACASRQPSGRPSCSPACKAQAGARRAEGKGKGSRSKEADAPKKGAAGGVAAMRDFAKDETLMFSPVPAEEGALRCVYAYPNDYTVGITSLGYQLVWAFLAKRPDVDVRRLFMDANETLPQDPALVGFSLSWELDYANVLTLLERLSVPLLAEDRGDDDPIVFGGGGVLTGNPEPYASFFDVVLLGDGENLLGDFFEGYKAATGGGGTGERPPRLELLKALSQIPGVYCPTLYEVKYESATGPVASVSPRFPGVPEEVAKQTYRGDVLASSTVVSPRMAWENIFMVEVVRSCPEMCRFCHASYMTLPFRPADVEGSLLPLIDEGLRVTRRVGLLGASVTQHPEFDRLLDHMMKPEFSARWEGTLRRAQHSTHAPRNGSPRGELVCSCAARDGVCAAPCTVQDVRLSVASVRAGTVTPKFAQTLSERNTQSLTIAVESGSARVRRIVNKKLDAEEVQNAVRAAADGGLDALKLYGMVGIPGEDALDVEATIDMLQTLRASAPSLRLTFGCSTFVPKSHTPFQWNGVSTEGQKRLDMLEKALRQMRVDFRPESYKWSLIQAMLSRGDRRLTPLLLAARGFGDSLGSYKRAFKEMAGQLPSFDFYVHRDAPPGEEVLPWTHLRGPLPEKTLVAHAMEARGHMAEAPTGKFLEEAAASATAPPAAAAATAPAPVTTE